MGLVYAGAGVLIALLWVGSLIAVKTAVVKSMTSKEVQGIWAKAGLKAGLTKEDARLYRQAARLLKRLVHVVDLGGDTAADLLSPQSREMVETWLADYEKEINKV